MTGKGILEALNHVEERYIEEAESEKLPNYALYLRRGAAMAACLCLVILGLWAANQLFTPAETESIRNESDMEQEPAIVPENMEIQLDQSSMESYETMEKPSVILRIDSWTGDGFLGTVMEIVDTDVLTQGEEWTVLFEEDLRLNHYHHEDSTILAKADPDDTMFPVGTCVLVQFEILNEEDNTLLVDWISAEID